MFSIQVFKDIHGGLPALVMGGGEMLPSDLIRVCGECVDSSYISLSCNHHALKLIDATYVVFMDHRTIYPDVYEGIKDFKGIRVSTQMKESDVDLGNDVFWTGGYSSILAMEFALWCGCSPVYLCGIDLYQGKKAYFWDDRPFKPDPPEVFAKHLETWREAYNRIPETWKVCAVSGPLAEIFGKA